MPRSRIVVERTSAFGPASVRMVSLRAGIASMRRRQLMGRRAMPPGYARVRSLRKWERERETSCSTDVLERRRRRRREVAALLDRVGLNRLPGCRLDDEARGAATLEREREAAAVAHAVVGAIDPAEDAPAH